MSHKEKNQGRESRRRFLKTGIASGVIAVTLPALSVAEKGVKPFNPFTAITAFELDELTIDDLATGFSSGKYSIRSVAQKYIQRIHDIDKNGPAINSVIQVNPDALKIADALDLELKQKGPRSRMHGIPVLLKDNIDTADNMETTAGSFALLDARPQKDSFVVKQLRSAGALILGKTNLSEWANMRSTHSTSGWSGRGGLTKNPYALDRNCSGSSSGSAAAAAASLCAVAIGTETDGSVVSPCSINGLVGIKPTVGLVSRAGIIPISHSQDTAGPMTRTVKDAAILLGAMAGEDEEDTATKTQNRTSVKDYTKFLDKDGLHGARIGVLRQYFGFLPSVDKIMDASLAILKKKGAILIDPIVIDTLAQFNESEGIVLRYELKADMESYLKHRGNGSSFKTLKDLIDFNTKHADKEMPYFGQELFLQALSKGPLTDAVYLKALENNHRMTREKGIDAVMNKHKLDAIISPTDSPAWMTDLVNGDHFLGGSSQIAAVAGYPHITVPAGDVFGLPVGISFFGRAWSEPVLLRIAYAFEQASLARKPPKFLATAKIG